MDRVTDESRRGRARVEQVRAIEEAAFEELRASGPAALSLRAVARRLDLVPSALYRYFDGRDALLTALIVAAYTSVGDVADGAFEQAGPSGGMQWTAVGEAVRGWALLNRSEWALIYGTPVPAYSAPAATTEPGVRLARLLLRIVADSDRSPDGREHVVVGRELRSWVRRIRLPEAAALEDEAVVATVVAFEWMIGAISMELFGQFGADATPAGAMYSAGWRLAGRRLGLPGLGR